MESRIDESNLMYTTWHWIFCAFWLQHNIVLAACLSQYHVVIYGTIGALSSKSYAWKYFKSRKWMCSFQYINICANVIFLFFRVMIFHIRSWASNLKPVSCHVHYRSLSYHVSLSSLLLNFFESCAYIYKMLTIVFYSNDIYTLPYLWEKIV